MSDLHIPAYSYLVANGIQDPATLVQHGLMAGLVHPPKPTSTIPRCPCGKKAADLEARIRAHDAISANRSANVILAQALGL